jgi:hypothetical protein
MSLTPQKRAAIDRKIEEAIGRLKIRSKLDFRYSEGKNWKPYERYLLSNDHTIFVNLAADPVTVKVSEEPDKKAVRKVEQKEKRAEERAARKQEREAKKAERAAKPKTEKKPKAERKAAAPKADKKPRTSKFTPEREKRIAEIIAERGCSRGNAIRALWNEEAVKEADNKLVDNVVKNAAEDQELKDQAVTRRVPHDPLASAKMYE